MEASVKTLFTEASIESCASTWKQWSLSLLFYTTKTKARVLYYNTLSSYSPFFTAAFEPLARE